MEEQKIEEEVQEQQLPQQRAFPKVPMHYKLFKAPDTLAPPDLTNITKLMKQYYSFGDF